MISIYVFFGGTNVSTSTSISSHLANLIASGATLDIHFPALATTTLPPYQNPVISVKSSGKGRPSGFSSMLLATLLKPRGYMLGQPSQAHRTLIAPF